MVKRRMAAAKVAVGSRVKCTNATGTPLPYFEVLPRLGVIYTIRNIVTLNGDQCFRLKEIVNPPHQYKEGTMECAFRATRFVLQTGKK
jgi:hypothetical protein